MQSEYDCMSGKIEKNSQRSKLAPKVYIQECFDAENHVSIALQRAHRFVIDVGDQGHGTSNFTLNDENEPNTKPAFGTCENICHD